VTLNYLRWSLKLEAMIENRTAFGANDLLRHLEPRRGGTSTGKATYFSLVVVSIAIGCGKCSKGFESDYGNCYGGFNADSVTLGIPYEFLGPLRHEG
jgi:hypothetical protein